MGVTSPVGWPVRLSGDVTREDAVKMGLSALVPQREAIERSVEGANHEDVAVD